MDAAEIERKVRWLELVARGSSPQQADRIMAAVDRAERIGLDAWFKERSEWRDMVAKAAE